MHNSPAHDALRAPAAAAADGRHHPTRSRSHEWEDPATSAAAARELDGISFFREMQAGRIPPPPIAASLGFGPVSVEPGRAVFDITPAEYHDNPTGALHGGPYATPCDTACPPAAPDMVA